MKFKVLFTILLFNIFSLSTFAQDLGKGLKVCSLKENKIPLERIFDMNYSGIGIVIWKGLSVDTISTLFKRLNNAPNIKFVSAVFSGQGYDLNALPLNELKHVDKLSLVFRDNVNIDLETLWSQLSKMPNLKSLELSGYQNSIDISINKPLSSVLKNLKWLHVSGLNIEPDVVSEPIFTDLKTLKIRQKRENNSNLSCKTIIDFFSKSEGLENLQIIAWDTIDIENFTNLNNFKKLSKLCFYAFEYKTKGSILDYLDCVKTLKHLDYEFNGKNGDFRIGRFSELRHLTLEAQNATDVYNELTPLTKLKYLDLTVSKIPNTIYNLTSLDTLILERAFISDNLEDKEKPRIEAGHLKYLSYKNVRLFELPERLFFSKKLETLMIHQRGLDSLDERIGRITSLKKLSIPNHALNTIPDLSKLVNLEYLDLGTNEYRGKYASNSEKDFDIAASLVRNIENLLPKLSYLNIEGIPFSDPTFDLFLSQLRNAPEDLKLNITDCKITKIPKDYWKDIKIQEIQMAGNPYPKLPSELYKANINRVRINYTGEYFSTLNNFKLYGYFNNHISLEEVLPYLDFKNIAIDVKLHYSRYHYSKNSDFIRPAFTELIAHAVGTDSMANNIHPTVLGNYFYDIKDYKSASSYLATSVKKIPFFYGKDYFDRPTINRTWLRYLMSLALIDDRNVIKDLDFIFDDLVNDHPSSAEFMEFVMPENVSIDSLPSFPNLINSVNKKTSSYNLTILSMLYKSLGENSRALTLNKIIKEIILDERSTEELKTDEVLDLLVIYFVTNNFTEFDSLISLLESREISENEQLILYYLETLRKHLKKEDISNEIQYLVSMRNRVTGSFSWSTNLVNIWSLLSKDNLVSELNLKFVPWRKKSPYP